MDATSIPYTGREAIMSPISRIAASVRRGVLPLLVAAVCLRVAGDRPVEAALAQRAFSVAMPSVVLWAWEEPEDLRSAEARSVGVAYLDKSIELGGPASHTGAPLTVRRRHQPLAVAEGAQVMAVVRVNARGGFEDTSAVRTATAEQIAEAASRTGVRALQVDFDAKRSQRGFYADVLRRVRQQMPAGMPLSMTALTSWCDGSASEWINSLPVDEAVPMFFRLGGQTRPYALKDGKAIREPLCRRALGLSTDESWPTASGIGSRRVYLFSPTPWSSAQLAAATSLDTSARPAVLRVRDDAMHAAHGINDTGLPRPTGAPQQEQP